MPNCNFYFWKNHFYHFGNDIKKQFNLLTSSSSQTIQSKNWAAQFSQFQHRLRANQSPSKQVLLHPCVIAGKESFVYERNLAQKNPGLFDKLQKICRQKKIQLQEDRRAKDLVVKNDRRKNWVTITVISLGIFLKSTALYAHENHVHQASSNNTPTRQQATKQDSVLLGLFAQQKKEHKTENLNLETLKEKSAKAQNKSQQQLSNRLFHLLKTHYQASPDDPNHIISDLKSLAQYYSQFPESSQLLLSLAEHPWQLSYRENHWATKATGNHFSVSSAEIYFDPRAAAQLRLRKGCNKNPQCIISPADALLHELLHAKSMLIETDKFIRQGGMSDLLYPIAHEMSIIAAEKSLYRIMENRDGFKRPQRSRHTGRIVSASCVTCIN